MLPDRAVLKTVTILACVLLYGIQPCKAQTPSGEHQSNSERVVFAHYMHCFVCGYMTKEQLFDESGANDLEHFPKTDKSYREWWSTDLAAQCVSGRDSALKLDFKMGERAGLDAFGLLFHRGLWPNSQYAQGLEAMFRVAQSSRVKVLPEIWEDSPKGISDEDNAAQLAKFGSDLKKLMDRYPSGVLKIRNRPVMLLATLDKQNCERLTPFFKSWGGPKGLFLIAYVHPNPYSKSEYLDAPVAHLGSQMAGCPVQAISQWTAANDYGDLTDSALPQIASSTHTEIVWPVNLPFYNVRPEFANTGPQWVAESLGATRFIDQWRHAIDNQASMVDLQTWNDFSETALTDTNHQGLSFIDLDRYFADEFHKVPSTRREKDTLWLFYHHQLIGASTKGHRSDDPGNRNTTPLTDFIEAISNLVKPGQLSLDLDGAHYDLQVPAGFHEWLLIAGPPRVKMAPRATTKAHDQAFERADSYPTGSAFRTVQRISSLHPGLPILSLKRAGKITLALKGRANIQSQAPLEDLEIVGTEAESQ